MNMQSALSLSLFKTRFAMTVSLILGFVCAVGLRVSIGAPDTSHSVLAGLLFAACLMLLTIAAGTKAKFNARILITGLAGGFFLCVPALTVRFSNGSAHTPDGNFLLWSLIVAIVAFAEEAFLRGALYDKISGFSSQLIAIVATAIMFAALHVPLYGLRSVLLDLVVGLWLGALRYKTGSFVAPGIAHMTADLAAWWII